SPLQDSQVNGTPADFADVHQVVRPTVDAGKPRRHHKAGESFPKNRKNNLLYPRNSALYHVVSLCQSRRSRNDVAAGDVSTGWPVPVHYVVTEFDRESRPVDQGDKRVLAPGVYIDAGIAGLAVRGQPGFRPTANLPSLAIHCVLNLIDTGHDVVHGLLADQSNLHQALSIK